MKVLMCGLGSIGQRHVRLLRQLLGDAVEIHAFRQRGLDLVIQDDMTVLPGATPAAHYGLTAHTSLDAALAVRPEIAFITNPISLHVPMAQRMADAGCHLFLEKPVGHCLAGLAELQATVQQRKLVAAVGYQLRFHPALQRIKTWLAEGVLGRVISASIHFGEWLPGMHPYEDYRISHAARHDQGGGVILCLSHEIDYACWLFGWPREVMAMGGQWSDLEMDAEDTADLFFEGQSGGHAFPVSVHVDFLQRPARRTCLIVGDAATVEWDYLANRLWITRAADRSREEITFAGFTRNAMFLDELKNFLGNLAGSEPLGCPLKDGIDTLAVCLAAREALAARRPVAVPFTCEPSCPTETSTASA